MMDFQSAMETFAEAWIAANAGQQSQALARAAAAAAAAANVKSPSAAASLVDMAVKKEHSPSPPHSGVGAYTSGVNTPLTSSAATSGSVNNANDDMHSHQQQQQQHQQQQHNQHRRSSLQGVQEKLTQLQMHQQQQQQLHQQHHHQHQQHQHHQHQQHQQQQHQHPQQQHNLANDETRSPPRFGRRSADVNSPLPSAHTNANTSADAERNALSSSTSSQNASLAPTPKLDSRSDERAGSAVNVGSISCLPPAALGMNVSVGVQQQAAAAAAAVAAEKVLAQQALEARRSGADFDVAKVNSKSLPLHCVVESVHSLQASLNSWKRRPNVEMDSYVIIAASTPWSEIVHTALQRLGFSLETANTARGSLIIKNWKPIPLEQISDNPVVPVSDIIGELTSVVTLRIVILRAKVSPFGEIKDKLLRLLVLQSHALLRSTACPLDEVTLSQICRSSHQNMYAMPGAEISDELRREFDKWWSNQLSPKAAMLPFMTAPATVPSEMDFPAVAAAAAAAAAQAAAVTNASVTGGNPLSNMVSRESLLLANENAHHGAGMPTNTAAHHGNIMVHPAMHASMHHHHHHGHGATQYPSQKTRMRTSFDPEMELPKLQKWFQENPHPSRQQIQTYVLQLNELDSRRGRKPLDVNNVVYWFKNARAAQKRAEMRGGLGSAMSALGHAAMNGYLSQHTHLGQNSSSSAGSQQMSVGNLSMTHDYLKSPLSLKSEDIDTMSQHSDDMDEEQMRPSTPQLPLSLTIHERNRESPAVEEPCDERRGSALHKQAQADELNGSGKHMDCKQDAGDQSGKSHDLSAVNEHETNSNQQASNNQEHDNEANNNNSSNHNTLTNNNSSNNNNNNSNNDNSSVDNQINNESVSQIDGGGGGGGNHTPHNQTTPKEEDEDLDMDEDDDDNDNENDTSHLDEFESPSPDMSSGVVLPNKDHVPFPMVSNSMFPQSFIYMTQYMPTFGQTSATHQVAAETAARLHQSSLLGASGLNLSNISSEERRKRNRTFIDPVTEVPKLEQWFAMNTHPSHNLILKYTEDLNTMPYRQKFPRLESKNVQFWFKNRRAKCKRLKMSLYDSPQCSQLALPHNAYVHKYEERD